MKNFAFVSVLLVCFLVGATAGPYAVVDLDRVSVASQDGVPYAEVADYAPGRFCSDKLFSSQLIFSNCFLV